MQNIQHETGTGDRVDVRHWASRLVPPAAEDPVPILGGGLTVSARHWVPRLAPPGAEDPVPILGGGLTASMRATGSTGSPLLLPRTLFLSWEAG